MGTRACQPDTLRQRAATGDPALLEDLFACYRHDLLGFLRRRCGNPRDADDATQDAFEAAARYLSGYRGETPLKNWLYRLASSACTRMRRGRKNDHRLHDSFEEGKGGGVAAVNRAVEAMLEARLSPLKKAMDTLAPVDRAVLLLRDGEEMSTREVADALHLTEPAVKARLHRARKVVKEQIAGGPPHSLPLTAPATPSPPALNPRARA